MHTADSVALRAQTDLTAAYNDAAGRPATATIPVELGGTTRATGVYVSPAGTFGITGTLILDAQGNPDTVFIFKAASTLITASASTVKLVNGARPGNVFWLVGSSATLGTFSTFRGDIMALASITVTTGVTIDGRAGTSSYRRSHAGHEHHHQVARRRPNQADPAGNPRPAGLAWPPA